jgi:lysophospholipase L1-like esterase
MKTGRRDETPEKAACRNKDVQRTGTCLRLFYARRIDQAPYNADLLDTSFHQFPSLMKYPLRSVLKALLAFPVLGNACFSAEPATHNGNERMVFIGDSITGQGGGWRGAGYVFKMGDALRAVYPEGKHELIPLGGSGMGVNAWLALASNEAKQKVDLDVKGVEVAAALSQTADVLVVMLGMNDVLAPYVNETDASLDQWLSNYRKLVGLLREKLQPKVIALATVTPQTEDPATPVNRVLARMNQRITTLAAELKANVVPTQASYWETLAEGRKTQADFTLAADRIHPNATGHVAMAMAMLKGLSDDKAAAWLREEKLTPAPCTCMRARPTASSCQPLTGRRRSCRLD